MKNDTASKMELKKALRDLAREKNAIILAHYYTEADVQDAADFVGDSLALAQKAAQTEADIILMCGVHFMAETCKILSPQAKVLIPDTAATCSLAESCPADAFAAFVSAHPDHKVVSYVNTSAAIKALTDVVVTSGNAREIVESFPIEQPLIFGPDKNLGAYINSITGRQMLLWDGACHVHERFSLEKLIALRREHPKAEVLVHPECRGAVRKLADVVGSTARLLKHTKESDCQEFLVVTESGILHQMQQASPEKTFIPVPPDDPGCACNECQYMRLNTLQKAYNALLNESPEVTVPASIAARALQPIERMLEISRRLGL